MKQMGIFSEEERLKKLSQLGDTLERLEVIDWTVFQPVLAQAFQKERKSNAGRPPYDYLMMFKILVLQRLYNISDDQTEYQINDRISFMRFLDLTLADTVPDAKTIWAFRERLTCAGAAAELFELFNQQLEAQGIISHAGTIVDATFVEAPRQRNTRAENKSIKKGEIPEDWKRDDAKTRHKCAQKDIDARWTKKENETHYGYKDHAKVDADSKIITDYEVTAASVHDSQEFSDFIDETDRVVYADSAYASEEISRKLPPNVDNQIHERAYRGHPLTPEQKENNRQKSKIRVRIEHVFGFITGSMHGITIRTIGIKRARFNIGLTNLIYNMCRYSFLKRKETAAG